MFIKKEDNQFQRKFDKNNIFAENAMTNELVWDYNEIICNSVTKVLMLYKMQPSRLMF